MPVKCSLATARKRVDAPMVWQAGRCSYGLASGSMLLWSGKWVRGSVLGDQGEQGVEDLAGDVALQAADDLGLRQAFVSAALGVSARPCVIAEPDENDDVECIVGATVTAAIEPVSVGASAAGGDRRGAAEVREGGFGLDPVSVVAGADEHLAGDLGSNPGKGKQGGATWCTS
jgi:hypothetical protein